VQITPVTHNGAEMDAKTAGRQGIRRPVTLMIGCGLLLGWQATAADGQATLRFAAACADCHEGECSGRLSFARRPVAAATHIRQYAGPVSDDLARGLYAALERMKAECRYQMPTGIDLLGGELAGNRLTHQRDAWSGNYIIPLTPLAPGRYRLSGELRGNGRIRIEAVDEAFDHWADDCLATRERRFAIELVLPETHRVFLRLRPADKEAIIRLSLQRAE